MTNKQILHKKRGKFKQTTGDFVSEGWRKELERLEREFPVPPRLRVVAIKQTPYEKKMAKFMNKWVDYEMAQAKASKFIKTPWGVITWTPKQK
mgnify:CR=1 FL=1